MTSCCLPYQSWPTYRPGKWRRKTNIVPVSQEQELAWNSFMHILSSDFTFKCFILGLIYMKCNVTLHEVSKVGQDTRELFNS